MNTQVTGLLHKAQGFVENIYVDQDEVNVKKQILVLLFFGRTSLLLKSFLEEFAAKLEQDRSHLKVYCLSVDKNLNSLQNLIENITFYKEENNHASLQKLTIWPAFLLPGTFSQYSLQDVIDKFQAKTKLDIILMEPLDFKQEIYPFLLNVMKKTNDLKILIINIINKKPNKKCPNPSGFKGRAG